MPRMNQFVLHSERKFQTTHIVDSQSHNSTLCRSNSHCFERNITLRNESHKITNLIKSKGEQNYKIYLFEILKTVLCWFQSILIDLIKSPNTSKIAEANYQNQDSILAVDTNLRIIQNVISIVQLY